MEEAKVSINVPSLDGKQTLEDRCDTLLSWFANTFEAVQGLFYFRKGSNLNLISTYAFIIDNESNKSFEVGEGFIGEVARTGKPIYIEEVPDGYINVFSGLGSSKPSSLIVFPAVNEKGEVTGVYELALFRKFDKSELDLINEMSSIAGKLISEKPSKSKK